RAQVQWAWERSPFYRRAWEAAGVSPATLRTLADLRRFPVIQKADLRAAQAAHPPFGDYLCLAPGEVARIHGTSGTTGRPTVFGVGRDDWERIGEAHARILWGAGIRPGDTVLVASFFSLYLGSWGALKGCERLGATAFPFGAGLPGQTLMAVQWARDLAPTAFYGTPSYALHFAATARREGIDPRAFGLRTSQPMIRLVSGDVARWTDEPCPCGRTYPRLPHGLYGRLDDMFIVRGENVYPSAIEDVLRAIDGFGGEFSVIVSRREAMDELL